MIIIGYQGIGKSTLANKSKNYIDLESSNFWHRGKRPDNWYIYYCNIAESLSKQGYNVFVSSHEVVRNRLKKYYKEELLCIIPSIELKDLWIRKLEDRWMNERTEKNYKAYMNAVDRYEDNINEIKASGIPFIEIDNINYSLENIIEYR